MSDFKEHMAADRRLVILRLLHDYNGSANESVIRTALEKGFGHRTSRDELRNDLRMLVDNGCIVSDYVGEIQVVQITRRGVDVSKGLITVAGILQPSIGV